MNVGSRKADATPGHLGTAAGLGHSGGRAELGSLTPEAPVYFEGKTLKTKIYFRDELAPRRIYSGAAIITEYSATTVIPPTVRFRADKANNLIISMNSHS